MKYNVPFYKPTYINAFGTVSEEVFYFEVADALNMLEDKFAKLFRQEFTLAVNNPSSGIHLAMCAIDLKRGDKVICAVNSYVDVPESIRHFDSEPIFADIEPETYHISIESLKEVIKKNRSKKLRAVVISHFAGLRQDISEIKEIAKDNNLIVVEDFTDAPAIESNIEVNGDIAVFSLNYKLDNTLKGGMLTFKEKKHFERAKLVREHGLVLANRDVSYLYDIKDVGCDYRLDNLNAYFLKKLLEKREQLILKKKEIAEIYFEQLENVSHIKLPLKSENHPYSYFVVEVDKNRDAFARELKALGIEVGLHYIPLNFTSYYKQKYGLKIFSFPNALKAYQKIMSLPCNAKMSKKDALTVCDAIKKVASKHI